LRLAAALNAEILSLDSMAVYRGLDIGTAKPSAAERAAMPHHLLDLRDPHEEFSVAEYRAAAIEAVQDILARGKTPLFVGGTPLYLKALLRGLFQGPPADWDLRRQYEALAAAQGAEALHARLQAVDPAAAAKFPPGDQRRIIRGLEVFTLTGRPLSEQQREFDRPVPQESVRVFMLDWPRPLLYERINARVEQMFAAGLVAETARLLALPRGLGRTARQAVGYREVLAHLETGVPLVETITLARQNTRQFAKRQGTWFRSLSECRFVSMSPELSADDVCSRILSASECD